MKKILKDSGKVVNDYFDLSNKNNICDHYKYEVRTPEVMPDHIHLFVSVKPYVSPTEVVHP